MAQIPRAKGNTDNRLRPDGIEWHTQTQKQSVTLTYEGLYTALLAAMPAIGQTVTDFPSTLKVEDVVLKKHVRGKGTMTVLLEVSVIPPTEPAAAEQPVYELEWTGIERPIEQHPIFASLFPDPTGQQGFSSDQLTALNDFNAWENADPSTKIAAYNKLSPDFTKLANKKLKGTTTYTVYAPNASITQIVRDFIATNACGIYSSTVPGFDKLPPGYQWVSTADHCTRTGEKGKWQRRQQWIGVDSVDTDLYQGATSSTNAVNHVQGA